MTPVLRDLLPDTRTLLHTHEVMFPPVEPAGRLFDFFEQRQASGIQRVLVVDLGGLPPPAPWVFVADGILKSGRNPLRGITQRLPRPFIDTSYLYHVPKGRIGSIAVSQGGAYPAPDPDGIPCTHLQTLAIPAHTIGLQVSGLLLTESALDRLAEAVAIWAGPLSAS